MSRSHSDFLIFIGYFTKYVFFLRHVILGLIGLLLLGGVWVAYLEDLQVSESIYFAFITGLTIGYGDIEPVTAGGRVVSIVIGLIGMLFTGMTVAVATRALADTAKEIRDRTP